MTPTGGGGPCEIEEDHPLISLRGLPRSLPSVFRRLPESLHVLACPSKSQAGGRDPVARNSARFREIIGDIVRISL